MPDPSPLASSAPPAPQSFFLRRILAGLATTACLVCLALWILSVPSNFGIYLDDWSVSCRDGWILVWFGKDHGRELRSTPQPILKRCRLESNSDWSTYGFRLPKVLWLGNTVYFIIPFWSLSVLAMLTSILVQRRIPASGTSTSALKRISRMSLRTVLALFLFLLAGAWFTSIWRVIVYSDFASASPPPTSPSMLAPIMTPTPAPPSRGPRGVTAPYLLASQSHTWLIAEGVAYFNASFSLTPLPASYDSGLTFHPIPTAGTRLLQRIGLSPATTPKGVGVLPLWPIAMGLLFLNVLAWQSVLVSWIRAIPPGHCRHCGYNLTGNTSGICPECGNSPIR